MIFSTTVVVSVLSLLSFTSAATISARGDDCKFVCPDKGVDGDTLQATAFGDKVISCSYSGHPFKWCTYDPVSRLPLSHHSLDLPAPQTSGKLVGDGKCPDHATQQCATYPREHGDKHDGGHHDGWKRDGPPPTTTPYANPSTWVQPSPYASPSSWGPSSPKPNPSTPTAQPCNFRCPLKDTAGNSLTDEAIRTKLGFLFCVYRTSHCDTCNFCKYDTVSPHASNCSCDPLTCLDRTPGNSLRITMTATVPAPRPLLVLGTAALEGPL